MTNQLILTAAPIAEAALTRAGVRAQRALAVKVKTFGLDGTAFKLESETGRKAQVDFGTRRAKCDCPDFQKHKAAGAHCKHILAVAAAVIEARKALATATLASQGCV